MGITAKKMAGIILASVMIVLFQNCGGSFATIGLDASSAGAVDQNSAPPDPSVPVQTSLNCTIFVSPSGTDSNSGKSPDLAVRTLQKASDLSSYGDVVCAAPGEYSEFTVRQLSAYAAENTAITNGILAASIADTVGIGKYVSTNYPQHARTHFISVETQKAVIRPKAAGVLIQRNFVDFDGFEVDGSQGSGFNVLLMVTGSHSRIMNNHVHHLTVPQSLIDSGNGGAGIDVAGSGNYVGAEHEIFKNSVHDIWGPPGVTSNLIHGIYMAVPGGYAHDNVVKDIVGFCYHSWHEVKEHRYENNVGSNCAGIVIGSDDNPCITDPRRCHTRDISIQNNQMANTRYGISVEGGYMVRDFTVERIVIHDNTRDGVLCREDISAQNTEQCPK
jgi:hypothetical protein